MGFTDLFFPRVTTDQPGRQVTVRVLKSRSEFSSPYGLVLRQPVKLTLKGNDEEGQLRSTANPTR